MKTIYTYSLALSLLLFSLAGCANSDTSTNDLEGISTVSVSSPAAREKVDEFGDYWYQGDAELTSYTLEQARYGEIHEGEAVLIFVTEDFSKSKQVKLDYPDKAPNDKVSVLKLNLTKKFNTGLYPYSMMASVFTPVQRHAYPHTLKVATSSQEWCGHTFTQLNLGKNRYNLQLKSYFESEGDQSLTFDDVLLEDELWTLIRLDPAMLPIGNFEIIPGTMYQRLSHAEWDVVKATASLAPAGDDGLMAYTVTYPANERTLKITFNKAFPHEIEGWEDTYRSGRGEDAPLLTTRAQKKKRIMLDYWTHNKNADTPLRQELELE